MSLDTVAIFEELRGHWGGRIIFALSAKWTEVRGLEGLHGHVESFMFVALASGVAPANQTKERAKMKSS